jgi:hypothetical protein
MTTIFENRYSTETLGGFLQELERDAGLGAIADNIVRMSLRRGEATYRMLNPHHMMARTNQPLAWWFVARYLEASYIARGQLQKLSAYGGLSFNTVTFLAVDPQKTAIAAEYEQLNAPTERRLAELAYKVQKVVKAHDLDLRSGATFIEDGPWIADPFSPIEPIPEPTCATCGERIYEANDQWRHDVDLSVNAGAFFLKVGRAEAYTPEPCSLCHGTGELPRGRSFTRCQRCLGLKTTQKLHHLADPVQAGRLV